MTQQRPAVSMCERVNTQIDVTSTDILQSMELHCTVKVPRRVLRIVRARLWCATRLIQLAGVVGGFPVVITDADASGDADAK